MVLEGLARRLSPSWLRVQLVLGDDELLRRLNRDFRGRDRATDVLSFLYETSRRCEAGEPHAEVYVSMQRVRVQAGEGGLPLSRELVLVVLHGLLHLQGHDHHTASDARRMRAAEVHHLRWLVRRWGWPRMQPLVPLDGTLAPGTGGRG